MKVRRSAWIIDVCLVTLVLIGGSGFWLASPAKADGESPTVAISEVFYNPSGSDTGHEWIELTNTGPETVAITDGRGQEAWRFFDTAAHVFTLVQGNSSIAPGTTAVLSADPDQFSLDYPIFVGTLFKVSLSLPNSHAELKLSADGGQTWFDQQSYASSDGGNGDGHSLEWTGTDWRASQTAGGTPGQPTVTGVPAPTIAPMNPIDTPTPAVSQASAPAVSPTSQPIAPAAPPTQPSVDRSAPPPSPAPPAPTIAITEIYYDAPDSDQKQEWIEFLNTGRTDLAVNPGRGKTAWRLLVGSHRHTLVLASGPPTIGPGQYFIIATDAASFASRYPTFKSTLLTASFSLPNTAGTIGLSLDGGTDLVVNLTYQASWGGAGNGASLEIDTSGHWHDSPPGGTPGQPPAVPSSVPIAPTQPQPSSVSSVSAAQPTLPAPSLAITEINYNPPGSDTGQEWIELRNTGTRTLELEDGQVSDWRLAVNDRHHILVQAAGPHRIAPGDYLLLLSKAATADQPVSPSVPVLTGSFSLPNAGGELALSIDGGKNWIADTNYTNKEGGDGDGRTLEQTETGQWRASRVRGGSPGAGFASETNTPLPNVFISEFARAGSPGDLPGSWVELCNSTASAVDLSGWRLSNQLTGGGYLFPADETGMHLIDSQACRVIDESVFGKKIHLAASGGEIHLFDPNDQPVDHSYYGSWPRGTVWNRPRAGGSAWSSLATPNHSNTFMPAATDETLVTTDHPRLLYDDQTATVIDQEKPRRLPLDQLPTSVGSYLQVVGKVQKSRAKSLILAGEGTSLAVAFKVPTGTKPTLHTGDQIQLTGTLTDEASRPALIISQSTDIIVLRSGTARTEKKKQSSQPIMSTSSPVSSSIPAPPVRSWRDIRPKTHASTSTTWLVIGMLGGLFCLTILSIRILGSAP